MSYNLVVNLIITFSIMVFLSVLVERCSKEEVEDKETMEEILEKRHLCDNDGGIKEFNPKTNVITCGSGKSYFIGNDIGYDSKENK